MKRLFTSESVTEGHPDKICDQISDAIVDAIMEKDPQGRVAAGNDGKYRICYDNGRNKYSEIARIQKIAREVICDIGYDKGEYGYDGNVCAILTAIDEQSADIAMEWTERSNIKKASLKMTMKWEKRGQEIRA